jgi:hypothetical protein
MRIIPANQAVAKSSAKLLRKQLELIYRREFSLQKVQELYARSLGYDNWRELDERLAGPHETRYLTDLSEEEHADEHLSIMERLAQLLGHDYMHGFAISAAEQAGLGYDIRQSAARKSLSTPWGLAYEQETVAPGIVVVQTGMHGGYHLDVERRAHMDKLFAPARIEFPESEWDDLPFPETYVPEVGKEWYEEHSEARLVEAAFPDYFDCVVAARGVRSNYKHLLPLLFGSSAEEYDRREDLRILESFKQASDAWFAVEDLGHQTQFSPQIRWGYYGLKGADALAWFSQKSVAASNRGRYFVSDGKQFLHLGDVIPGCFDSFDDAWMGAGPCVVNGHVIKLKKHTPDDFRQFRLYPSRH